jgi:hypothetical protein
MRIISNFKTIVFGLTSLIILTGCGGGSESATITDGSNINATSSGVFIDAKVKGLHYKTKTQDGFTDSNGIFKYKDGETIEFFIGNLSLGSTKASELITPFELAKDTDLKNPSHLTLNIAMILQNCDSNKTNSELLDVSKLKNYKFKQIDIHKSNDEMQSKITSLLATADFQQYMDQNKTLINTENAKEHLVNHAKKVKCALETIDDDSSFEDTFPDDMEWVGESTSVKDIERVFNNARLKDSTITHKLVMPTQEVWDKMTPQERGLYLVNNERYYRGIKPFEGISNNVNVISKKYAETLYEKGKFEHYADGNPFDRLDRDTLIKNNKDFFRYGENLYTHGSSSGYLENPIAKAIYGFIYDDGESTGGSYGHRRFCLAAGLKDNSGTKGVEGLVGFGIKRGESYAIFPQKYSTIVVMNAFDPADTWNHENTHTVPFCSIAPTPTTDTSKNTQFEIDNTKYLVVDKETQLMWQNSSIGHGERDKAIQRCENLKFANYEDWRLPTLAESKRFHSGMNSEGNTPNQTTSHCTAEIVTDGYVRTKVGASRYGKNPGDSINFRGGANIRCVRN